VNDWKRSPKCEQTKTHEPSEDLSRRSSDTHVGEEGEEGSDEESDVGKSTLGGSSEDL